MGHCALENLGQRSSLESPSVPLGPKHGKIELDFRQFLQVVDGNDSFVVDISTAIGERSVGGSHRGVVVPTFIALPFSLSFLSPSFP